MGGMGQNIWLSKLLKTKPFPPHKEAQQQSRLLLLCLYLSTLPSLANLSIKNGSFPTQARRKLASYPHFLLL